MKKLFEKWDVYKQKCTQADGDKGSYVSKKTETGEVASCHTSKEDAEASNRAKYASKNEEQLDEMSAVGAGSVAFAVNPDEKEDIKELLSTSTLKGGIKLKIRNGDKEHAGHVERSKHQGLTNVVEE